MSNKGLRPFFAYYGGKWRAAPHYPLPRHQRIIEPFAGAAGYSTRYADHDVILIERDPTLAAMWRYLIAATPEVIRALPLIDPNADTSLDDLDIEPSAKALIGFWLNKGAATPCKRPSLWMRQGLRPNSFWGEAIRERIALQVDAVSHWTVIEGDYRDHPLVEATWYVDPPYQLAGKHYKQSADAIDFAALGTWCLSLPGQTIVCENEGATWLPFKPFRVIKGNEGSNGGKRSAEAIWLSPDPSSLM